MSIVLVMLPPQSRTSRAFALSLASDVPELRVVVPETETEALAALVDADAAYGLLRADAVHFASNLRWLQLPLAGPPSGYFGPELISHPVIVTNMRGTYTDQVATHTVALLLALGRRLQTYWGQQQRRDWTQNYEPEAYLDFSVATILLVGLGAVGCEIANLLAPFRSNVVAADARNVERPPFVAELHPATHLDMLLPRSDAVIVSVPHTPATDRMFNQERFSLMKSDAVLVNVGRGSVVDIDDLVVAIKQGQLRGAGLDVLPEEPLPTSHELWGLEHVIITPHVAGAGRHHGPDRYKVLAKNAVYFVVGEPLDNVVDKMAGF